MHHLFGSRYTTKYNCFILFATPAMGLMCFSFCLFQDFFLLHLCNTSTYCSPIQHVHALRIATLRTANDDSRCPVSLLI